MVDRQRASARVVVIGAGIVGLATAWWLQRLGHRVTLVDPASAGPTAPPEQPSAGTTGSAAALGVLMGDVFHRASGRAWRLRQQSLALWSRWGIELAARGLPLTVHSGLLLLAATTEQEERLQRLAGERQGAGLPLELWPRERLADLQPGLPDGALSGLFSARDGQLDPLAAMGAFREDGRRCGLELCNGAVAGLRRRRGGGWQVQLRGGGALEATWVVLAAGLACPGLLAPLGHARPLEPVLGQALELELAAGSPPFAGWPGAVVWQGVNLIPRPGRRLWLGATLEPGEAADGEALQQLHQLDGQAPAWLRDATLVRRWQGLRARPLGRPAPLLETLEPGLLLAGGHYRNGILLAPASAQWVAEQIGGPATPQPAESPPCGGLTS